MEIKTSMKAVILIILLMIPNIVYFIAPPSNIPQTLGSKVKLIELGENVSRIASFLLLILMCKNPNASLKNPWVIGVAIFLMLYFAVWARYFLEGSSYELLCKSFLGIPMPMIIFPTCCLICAALWLNCIPAVIALIIFSVFHGFSLL